MKLTKIILLAAVGLTNGYFAGAQSNGVPGPADYDKFSAFVATRNIFDPNRVPHRVGTPYVRQRTQTIRPQRVSNSAPALSLVGTMSYEKGMFAFFNGNNSDLKKVLPINATIEGFTVTQIAQGGVLLESADKKQQLKLKIGDVLRQQGGRWELSGSGELPSGISSSAVSSSSSGGETPAVAPSPALSQNEVLKRLMELHNKENQ